MIIVYIYICIYMHIICYWQGKELFFQNTHIIVHLSEIFSPAPIIDILSKRNNISI